MSFLYSLCHGLILFQAPKVWEQTQILSFGVEYNAAESTSQLTWRKIKSYVLLNNLWVRYFLSPWKKWKYAAFIYKVLRSSGPICIRQWIIIKALQWLSSGLNVHSSITFHDYKQHKWPKYTRKKRILTGNIKDEYVSFSK